MTENITVKCKKCGHELPPDAQFCDNCGERVASVKKKQSSPEQTVKRNTKAIAAAVIILTAAICIAPLAFISGRSGREPAADPAETYEEQFAKMSSRITPEQYEQLDFGMSYDEVVSLLGEEGTQRYGSMYIWPGEYFDETDSVYDAPKIELGFGDNMNLIEIKERNILLGKEIYDAKKEGRVSEVTVNDEIFASMRNRMSYREIADILGAEGVLIEAESDKSGHDKKIYEWKYVMEGDEYSYGKHLDIIFYDDKARRSDWDEWGK